MREMNSLTLNGKKYDTFVDDKAREMIGRRSNLTSVSEIVGVARSYHKARYQADGVTPTFLYDTANTPLTGKYDPGSEEFAGAIDCSTYVGLILRGIPFEKSPYAHLLPGAQAGDDDAADADTGADNNNGDDNATDTDASGAGAKFDPASLVANVADFSWAINPFEWKLPQVIGGAPKPIRTASQLAQWMYERGMSVPLDETFSNLMPGDIVYWAKKKSNGDWVQPNRYKHISHVAICCGRYDAPKDDPNWDNWPAKYPYRHTTLEVTTISPYVLNRTLEVRSPGSVVMICRPDLCSSGDYKGNLSSNFGVTDISGWYRPGLYYLTSDVVGGLPDGVESGKYCTLRVEVSRTRQGSVRTITHTLINAKTNVATYINTQYCYNRLPGKDNWTGWRSEGSGSGSGGSQNVDLTGYATKQYVQNYAQPKGEYLTEETDPTVPSWAKQPNKPSYTAAEVGARPNTWMPTAKEVGALPSSYVPPDQTPEQVGADPAGTAEHTVDVHNTSTASHNDIRLLIEGLTTRLNALANSTDTDLDQMAELVVYIKSNKSLIDGITTNKINVVDIINNLTTNVANKPLSAAQGVAIKALIDNLAASLANYQPKGNYALASAVPTKVSQLANDKGYLTEHQDISGKADKFDPTVYGLPVLELTGDTAPIAVSKDNKVTLDYVWGERSGTCTLKGQGATSYKTAKALVEAGKAGKFNYTIKFDTAFEAKEGWGAQQKYCLKANFIDPTHSRNICSCKLWGMSVKSRTTVPAVLADLPNGGAIDGFPIIIMLNGEFHGLYTWNIPKDGWMFGLVEDTTKTQAIVGADDHTAATQFKSASMSGFEVEFVSDEDNAGWVETSLTRLISAVMNSDGSDLDTTVAQYLDWDSTIDHYIHTVVDKATDCVDKNYLLVTFDGVKWYMSEYDRDSIHGLNWDASGTTRPVSNVSFVECAETVRVYELIKRFKTNALKARYKELRGNILSESRIMEKFENFAWAIPSPVMLEDVKLYPTIMGSGVNTIDQIGRFVRQRLVRCDEWIDALPSQESTGGSTVTTYAVTNALSNCVSSNGATAVNANAAYSATITANDGYTLDGATVTITMGCTNITSTAYSNGAISIAKVTGAVVITISAAKKASGYTNLVPTSTDNDGSVYNGTGYKDNARLSSSGGVSGSAQDGSVVTGFIPYIKDAIIRMKGAEWLGMSAEHSGHHYYLSFYDSSKTLVNQGYVSSESYSDGSFGPWATYDATTGVTTFDFSGASSATTGFLVRIKDAAYFRINAYGKGADLIVTVNEEIT